MASFALSAYLRLYIFGVHEHVDFRFFFSCHGFLGSHRVTCPRSFWTFPSYPPVFFRLYVRFENKHFRSSASYPVVVAFEKPVLSPKYFKVSTSYQRMTSSSSSSSSQPCSPFLNSAEFEILEVGPTTCQRRRFYVNLKQRMDDFSLEFL